MRSPQCCDSGDLRKRRHMGPAAADHGHPVTWSPTMLGVDICYIFTLARVGTAVAWGCA